MLPKPQRISSMTLGGTLQNDRLSVDVIQSANKRIAQYVRKTPLEQSLNLSRSLGFPLHYKLENWQTTGSFKVRGAFNKLLSLSQDERAQGVITASAGNHGLGVAYAATLLGVRATIVVPETASPAKIKSLQNYKIELIKNGRDYDEAETFAYETQKRKGLSFVHAFSDPEIIAGQGTISIEIIEDLPDVQTIFVPVGGGGLVSGIAVAAKSLNPKIKVIGVQSEASPAMVNSLKSDRVVETPIAETIADGLAGRFVTDLTLKLTKQYVDDVCLVSEESIRVAIKHLLDSEHLLVEGSAAVGVAALLQGKVDSTGKTVCVLTGRNIDTGLVKKLL